MYGAHYIMVRMHIKATFGARPRVTPVEGCPMRQLIPA